MSSAAIISEDVCHFSMNEGKAQKIPLVVVEDHNEVLSHLYRAIGSKRLPFENGTIVHFDSHPDLMVPEKFDASRIFEKEYVFNSVSIESWILPALYAKHFSSVAWIKPPWSKQIKNGLHHFKVGCHKLLKEIKVTCPESYFVGELTWSSLDDLEEPITDLSLEVLTLVPEKWNQLTDNITHSDISCDSNISRELQSQLEQVPYVLDIDLDFYSTRNPFLSLFKKEQLDWISNLYHYEHPGDDTDEKILQEITKNRQEKLLNLKNLLLNPAGRDDTDPELLSMKKVFADGYLEDPELLFCAGCTCDECALPNHVSSQDQVLDLVKTTKSFLSSLPMPPTLITIARSSLDDYCPPEDVDFIQKSVLEMLQEIYGSVDILCDYDKTEDKTSETTKHG